MTLPTSGDGSARLRYNAAARQWEIRTNNTDVVTVAPTVVTVNKPLTLTGDVSAPGGQAQSFTFMAREVLQNTFVGMTASTVAVTSSLARGTVSFVNIPMVRSGSILGLVINTPTVVKSGAFSASVTVDGANTALTVAANTGSTFGVTAAKDTYTFNGFQTIGVTITASADYLCEPDVTSASFIATVLVEA